MQRKVLSVLIAALFVIMAVALPVSQSDEADAGQEAPRPYPDLTDMRTFQGIAKFEGDYLTADKLVGTKVIIIAAYLDTDGKLYYTERPHSTPIMSKEDVMASENAYNFSIQVPKIKNFAQFSYYLCVENGFKIAGVSDKLADIPVKVYPYPYNSKSPDEEPPWGSIRAPIYNAYKIENLNKNDPFWITGNSDQSRNIISLTPAKVTVSGEVKSGKFLLVNANVDFCKISSPEVPEYTGITDKNGRYYVNDVNTGTYVVRVHTNGYTAEPQLFDVMDGEPNILNLEMEQNNSGYFGYDLPHFLLMMGGVIGVILIVASLFFQYGVIKKKHDNWIYDDMKEEDKEE